MVGKVDAVHVDPIRDFAQKYRLPGLAWRRRRTVGGAGSADDHHLGASSRRHDPWQRPHEAVIAAQRLEIAGRKGYHLIGVRQHASRGQAERSIG
jgi:hypothetical protein